MEGTNYLHLRVILDKNKIQGNSKKFPAGMNYLIPYNVLTTRFYMINSPELGCDVNNEILLLGKAERKG